MNAVGYFVEGGRRNGARRSIGDQNRVFLEFCTRQGYEVAGTFIDTEASAAGGFRQMLQFLRRSDRGFAIVAVDNFSILGADLGVAAMKILEVESTGVLVYSAHTGRELARELVAAWAERGENTPVSERVRNAMRRKAVRGEVLGRPPYGYQVGPRRRLELVPEEAIVVRYIYRLYLQEGMGIRRIAGQLNAENVVTRRGGRWSMVTVRDILRNRAYLGTYTRFGVKVPASHSPLITNEDFHLVQARLQAHYPGERKRSVTPFLLSGLVYCGRCGNRLIGVSRRQKWATKDGEQKSAAYRYYQCESRTNQNACSYNTQRAAELEATIGRLLEDEDTSAVTRVRQAGNIDSYMLDVVSQAERVEGRIRKNRRQLEELVADAAHGHISVERMRALGAEMANEHQLLEEELAAARARVAAQESEAERRRHADETRKRLAASGDALPFAERQAGLREIIDRIEVDGAACRLFLRP